MYSADATVYTAFYSSVFLLRRLSKCLPINLLQLEETSNDLHMFLTRCMYRTDN